jgi:demethylmenaquinone methyltransferase / 2-methoxy-6-polyprenyl-1,4-benzoquinol methylase
MASTPIWEAQGHEKRVAVQGMFAEIAPTYDVANRVMSMSRHHQWRAFAASRLELKKGDSVLDLCCGTGDFLLTLRPMVGETGHLVGIDFCLPMLQRASDKDNAQLSTGDACKLPVQSAKFDGVTVGWGIRNVPDIDEAHREIFRVLKQGGRFVSVDTAVPTSKLVRWGSRFLCRNMLSTVGAILKNKTAYRYLNESTDRFKSREELAASMRSAGFDQVQFKNLMFGNICVHWGTKPNEKSS